DRIGFWDDSAGAFTWLTAGSGLTITDTTITASGSGVSFGADNQIPFTKGTTDDFDYSSNFTFDGTDLAVNTDDLFVDGSAGRVGIGTNSPAAVFAVNGAGSRLFNLVGDISSGAFARAMYFEPSITTSGLTSNFGLLELR